MMNQNRNAPKMDPKVMYLAKTLSRTKRKDYENYVINAVWNRVNHPDLVPVSQHFVRDSNGDHYYIDLYFPQLNIGVECDEKHHKAQKIADAERTYNITDVLWQGGGDGFTELRIDITENFDEVERQINTAVDVIKQKIQTTNLSNGWDLLNPNPVVYYKDKDKIKITDNIVFQTNNDVCNIILGKAYKGNQQQMITLYDGTYAWLPTKMDVNKPNGKGYANRISKDGKTIYENTSNIQARIQRVNSNKHIGEKRVVFAKTRDPITNIAGYRFLGIYEGKRYEADGTLVYERFADEFPIIR